MQDEENLEQSRIEEGMEEHKLGGTAAPQVGP